MESLTQSINQPLIFLIYTSIIMIVITGVFLVKLLIDLTGLVKSLDSFLKATQGELEPVIKEIKNTLININKISSNVTNQINNMNKTVQKGAKTVLEIGSTAISHAFVVAEIAAKSLKEGLRLLMKPKK